MQVDAQRNQLEERVRVFTSCQHLEFHISRVMCAFVYGHHYAYIQSEYSFQRRHFRVSGIIADESIRRYRYDIYVVG